MIHLVTPENHALYVRQLDEMHRQRKAVFIDQLGWSLVARDGGEYDDYDDAFAYYLLALDPEGSVEASMRLRPAHERSMIGDRYAHLVEGGVAALARPGVWEGSRILVIPRRRGPAGARAKAELRLATIEAVRRFGGERVIGLADTMWLPALHGTGWRIRPLGLPAPYEQGEMIAFEIAAGAADLAALQDALSMSSALLTLDRRRHEGVAPEMAERLLTAALAAPDDARRELARALREPRRVARSRTR